MEPRTHSAAADPGSRLSPRISDPSLGTAVDPTLAQKTVFVVIPQGHRAVSARIVDHPSQFEVSPPATGAWDGYQVASLVLRRSVTWSTAGAPSQVQLTVDTEPQEEAPLQRLRWDPEVAARTRARLQRFVANPEGLDAFAPTLPPPPGGKGPRLADSGAEPRAFLPTFDPSLDGSAVRYLIITSDALASAFQPLADWRTRRGIPAQIRTLEWIGSRTRHGVDLAETLRNFLIEAYQLWGIEWVLLGGDTEVVPARYGRTSLFAGTPDETLPTDLYFASLDGSWNEDHDVYWGEGAVLPSTPSEADILPELHVGRAPVRTVTEVTNLVNKIMAYETPVYTDYQQKVLFLSEVLVPANWDSTQAFFVDGATVSDGIIANSLPPEAVTLRYYDTYWLHPGSTKLTRNAALSQMNQAAGIVNHLGHGHRYNMSCGDQSVVNADVTALTNTDRSFVIFMANCTAGAFDFDCLGENYLRNPVGGASAVIGAARAGLAELVGYYNEGLVRQLFEYDQLHLGELLDSARLERAATADEDGADRQMQFSLNALGDPAMRIFSGPVATTALANASTITAGPGSLQVSVTADAQPVFGATVCAFKDSEVFALAETDSSGAALLLVSPQTAGSLFLNVSGKNITSVEHEVTVQPSSPELVRIASYVVDDDSVGSTSGNGDGLIDAGETVELIVQLQNTGGSTATDVLAIATSPAVELDLLADSLSISSLAPGATAPSATPLRIAVADSVGDGVAFDLALHVTTAGGGDWDDKVHVVVCAPKLEVLRVDTQPQGGTSLVTVELKNYGNGAQVSGTASISAQPPVQVIQGSRQLASIPGLNTATVSPPFEIDVDGGIGTGLDFSFNDAYGRLTTHHVDLVPPAAATSPAAEVAFSSGALTVSWMPPADADLFGYHVFRAAPSSGFERLTPDIILHTEYLDTDITANTQYHYYIVAVDSSRQWSAPSETLQVTSSAALLAGWPLDLGNSTASSVAVGDIDGDFALEVIVGALGLWAWHADGTEVRDGDGLPSTQGLFSSLPGTLNSSIALGEFNNQPGLEMVAAPWLSNSLYVFDSDGNILPGWPKTPSGGPTGYWGSPAIGDIDDDGQPEIAIVSKGGWVHVWHHDGTPLIPGDGKVRYVGVYSQGTPALADLTNDGQLEIVVTSATGILYVLKSDGTDLPGWPINLNKVSRCSAVVGDVDGDGTLEIVATSQNDLLHVFKPDGSYLSGFPVSCPNRGPDFGSSPALGDLDGDGKLEIVVAAVPTNLAAATLRIYNYQGIETFSKPLGNWTQSSPVLADLDGDDGIDIVIAGEEGIVHAWDQAGNELSGFPIPTGDFVRGTPTYADVDLDGMGELVLAGWNRLTYVWKMDGAYRPHRAPWPTFHGDMARRGALSLNFPTPVIEAAPPAGLLARWSPNPFNPRVTLRLAVPAIGPANDTSAARVPVRVDLFDVRGRLVRNLVNDKLVTGWHEAVWDGRDMAGRSLPSGVYLYRIEAGARATTGKISLLR